MDWLRLLRRAALRGALLGLLLVLGAAIMSGAGGTRPVPLGTAFGLLEPVGLGWAAGIGALAAMALVLLLRAVPAEPRRALVGGLVMGAAAMAVLHQPSLYVLHHAFRLVPQAGFQFGFWPPFGALPAFYILLLFGALGGAVLSLLLRLLRALPDLLSGFVFGALGLTLLGWLLPLPALPNFTTATPSLWFWLAVNGGWGWGVAFLLRPLDLRGGH
jgi:hypothetical protein